MWFLFIAVPAVASVTASLFSLTGGMKFAVTAVVTEGIQRKRGYRPGEGHFTERVNDLYYGVWADPEATCQISRNLGKLTLAVPSLLGTVSRKKFDLTLSEGEFLRLLMLPALAALEDLAAAKQLVEEQGDQEAIDLLIATTEQLGAVTLPVAYWLEQFPRVKEEV